MLIPEISITVFKGKRVAWFQNYTTHITY